MDVVNTVGALRCGEHEVGISVEYAPPPRSSRRSSPRAALHHTQRPRRRHVARLPPDPRVRGAAHARAGRRGRLPLAVAAVGGEDARARVGCERLGALLVVRRRRLAAAEGDATSENIYSRFCHGLPIDEVTDFILRLGEPPRELEVVSENQRRRTLFQPFEENGLLPTDYAGGWSDERVTKKLDRLDRLAPPRGWEGWRASGWSTSRRTSTRAAGNTRRTGRRRTRGPSIRKWHAKVGASSHVSPPLGGTRRLVLTASPFGLTPPGLVPHLARRAAAGERQRRVAADGGGVAGGGGGGGAPPRALRVRRRRDARRVGAGVGHRRARAAVA